MGPSRSAGLLLIAATIACSNGSAPARLAIVGASVVPMTGSGVLHDQTILIEGGSIVALGPRSRVVPRRGSTHVRGEGRFVLPGLLDMHVHVTGRRALRAHLARGVTTVRNMRGAPAHLLWREAIAQGELVAPSLLTSGPILDGPGSEGRDVIAIATPAQARLAVLEQAHAGYDFVKVYDGLSAESYSAVMETARTAGLPVAGHVPRAVGLEGVLRAGQDSIEHSETLSGERPRALRRLARLAMQRDVWLCPTLALDRFFGSPSLRRESAAPVATFHAEGGSVLLGTDTRPDLLVAELLALRRAGLTSFEALAAATTDAARFLGRRDLGIVAVGARADLVLLGSNPLERLEAVADVEGVVLAGRWLSARRLARLVVKR